MNTDSVVVPREPTADELRMMVRFGISREAFASLIAAAPVVGAGEGEGKWMPRIEPDNFRQAWARSNLSTGQMAEAYQCIYSILPDCAESRDNATDDDGKPDYGAFFESHPIGPAL